MLSIARTPLTAAVALALAALACSGPEPLPTPTPSPTPDPRALLEASGEAMASLTSFHFHLEHDSGGTALMPGLILSEAEGDVIRPDSLSADLVGSFSGFPVNVGFIVIGNESYMSNPLTGGWEPVPTDVSPLGFFDPSDGIAGMMVQLQEVSLMSDSGDIRILQGVLDAEVLMPLFGATVEGSPISVELTIDGAGNHVVKAVLDGRITPDEPDGMVRTISLSQFDEPIDIQPPPQN